MCTTIIMWVGVPAFAMLGTPTVVRARAARNPLLCCCAFVEELHSRSWPCSSVGRCIVGIPCHPEYHRRLTCHARHTPPA